MSPYETTKSRSQHNLSLVYWQLGLPGFNLKHRGRISAPFSTTPAAIPTWESRALIKVHTNQGSHFPVAAQLVKSNPGGLLGPMLVSFYCHCDYWWYKGLSNLIDEGAGLPIKDWACNLITHSYSNHRINEIQSWYLLVYHVNGTFYPGFNSACESIHLLHYNE